MKTDLRFFRCLLPAGMGLLPLAGQGGTVITTNLPAGISIVNIDAKADGCGTFNGGPTQAFWYQPTPTAPAVVIPAGTYRFRVINPTDAIVLFPALTFQQWGLIYTGWTFNSPWSENFLAFSSTAKANPNEFQLFDGALDPAVTLFGSAALAYAGTVANGYYDKIRPAPPGRAGITPADYRTEYTFAVETTVLFVIPDTILSDNNGGVSVVVTPAAPAIRVTAFLYDPASKQAALSWTSVEGADYAVAYSLNLSDWSGKVIASKPGAAGPVTTHTFPLPAGAETGGKIFFRVEAK